MKLLVIFGIKIYQKLPSFLTLEGPTGLRNGITALPCAISPLFSLSPSYKSMYPNSIGLNFGHLTFSSNK